MRQWIWRHLFAAAVGAFALAGTASAQAPVAPPPVVAQPAPGPVVPSVPAAIGGLPTAPGTVVVPNGGNGAVVGQNGTYTNGTYNGGYFMSGPTSTRLGNGPNGCGSCGQDAAFVLGSCRSFFSPCGGISNGCGGGHGHGGGRGHGRGLGFLLHGGCITPVGGHGATQGYNPCIYDSYLNH
jgi:hypothetical protein